MQGILYLVKKDTVCAAIVETLRMNFILFLSVQHLKILEKKYIARYFRENPSMFKLMQMLKESSNKTLQNLAIYCKKAFEARIDLINIVN